MRIPKPSRKLVFWTLAGILVAWGLLTWWVQAKGEPYAMSYGAENASRRAFILFDADPFYDLDRQVCTAMGEELSARGWYVRIQSPAVAFKDENIPWHLLVFCANTYNWAPDRSITSAIGKMELKGKDVVAVTLGSGSTERAKRLLEANIEDNGGILIASLEYWLLRPNDEDDTETDNVTMALRKVRARSREIAGRLRERIEETY